MGLTIKSVSDKEFSRYGRIVEGYDIKELLDRLLNKTFAPTDAVDYFPSVQVLEDTPAMKEYSDNLYGGMPIQIGYCNGTNTKLNCLEYHRDSEIDVCATDCVFLLAPQQDCMVQSIDTSEVEAFFCPAGTAVELYATTLHYAPCSARRGEQFKVGIVLPKGTNTAKPEIKICCEEDKRLFARNKWLIAHPEASEVQDGAVVAITGENVDIAELI